MKEFGLAIMSASLIWAAQGSILGLSPQAEEPLGEHTDFISAIKAAQTSKTTNRYLKNNPLFLEMAWLSSYDSAIAHALVVSPKKDIVGESSACDYLNSLLPHGLRYGRQGLLPRLLWDALYYKECGIDLHGLFTKLSFVKLINSAKDLDSILLHPPRQLNGAAQQNLEKLLKARLLKAKHTPLLQRSKDHLFFYQSSLGLRGEPKTIKEMDPDDEGELQAFRLRLCLDAIFNSIQGPKKDAFDKDLFLLFVQRFDWPPLFLDTAIDVWSQPIQYERHSAPPGQKVQWIPHHIRIWHTVIQSLSIRHAEDPRLHVPEETRLDQLFLYIWKRFMVDGVYADQDAAFAFIYCLYSVLRHRGYRFTQKHILDRNGEVVLLGQNSWAEALFDKYYVSRPVFVTGWQSIYHSLRDMVMDAWTGWKWPGSAGNGGPQTFLGF